MADAPPIELDRTLSRKERDWLRHEQEILDAAERVFCAKGFHAAGIQEIAAEADFGVGTIYRYFKSKDDIYQAMFLRKAQHVLLLCREAAALTDDPVEKLRQVVLTKSRYFHLHNDFFRIYFAEMRSAACQPHPGGSPAMTELFAEFQDWLTTICEDGIQRGIFRPIKARYLAAAFEGMGNAFRILYLEEQSADDFEQRLNAVLSIFFDGCCRRAPEGPVA
jgi:TetR/AcrR family transcriptional regulator